MEKQEISKRGFWEILLPALFLSFTFFIFGPLELYISNIAEFWFSLRDVLWPSVLAGFLVCMLLFLVGIFLRGNWREYYICLLIGVGVALYIQGNFVKTDYGVLDGRAIQWENYTSTAIWNTLLWIACIVLPFVGRTLFKKQYKTGVTLVSGCVLLVQMITLGTLFLTTDFSKQKEGEVHLSAKNLYTVSQQKNVIIFILDAFDQRFLDQILIESPEIADLFDGFTSYSNTSCMFPGTQGSMPYIMTGQVYKNEQPYDAYIEEACKNTDYYHKLRDEGFDIGLYTTDRFLSSEMKETFLTNAEKEKIPVKSPVSLEKAMLRLAAFRYFPHIIKPYVWFYSGVFDELKAEQAESKVVAFPADNTIFYQSLKEDGLKLLPDQNVYRLIHLVGAHPPVYMNSDITIAEKGKATYITQGKACLKIMGEYLNQLKELGIYDQSMVVITADHGESSTLGAFPIFMIKEFEQHGNLKFSETPISHSNLMPTIFNALGIETRKNENTIYQVNEADDIEREYYWFQWNTVDKNYMPDLLEYQVTKEGQLYLTGNQYTYQGVKTFAPYAYEIGSEIISMDFDPRRYFLDGLASIESNGQGVYWVWTWGKSGRILLNVGDGLEGLTGNFVFSGIYAPPQKLIIRSGDRVLYDGEIFSPEEIVSFNIPSECIKNGWLTLNLEYPNAISPESRGESADYRDLAFSFSSIRFYENAG